MPQKVLAVESGLCQARLAQPAQEVARPVSFLRLSAGSLHCQIDAANLVHCNEQGRREEGTAAHALVPTGLGRVQHIVAPGLIEAGVMHRHQQVSFAQEAGQYAQLAHAPFRQATLPSAARRWHASRRPRSPSIKAAPLAFQDVPALPPAACGQGPVTHRLACVALCARLRTRRTHT